MSVSRLNAVVCCFAHPDDETVLAGGLISMLAQQGIRVHIVCATRGEGGELGEPPLTTRDQLGAVRERELRCAVQKMGASLTILDYVDPAIGPDDVLSPFEADFDTLVRQFTSIAGKAQANLILTHGSDGEYGHPAHRLVHNAVVTGCKHLLPNTLLYTVAANVPSINDRLWNQNDMAHFALDIRPWSAQKIAAMECHETQHALFKRRRELKTVAEALRTVESVRRVLPEITPDDLPKDAFAELLQTAGAWIPDM